jgi:2-octaprenylphenol hydroxylase
MPMNSRDVLIIGGGVIGLSTAIAMRQRGFSVTLLDADTPSQTCNEPPKRVYALNQASEHLLTSLNAWLRIDPASLSPYRQMHVWDALQGGILDFDARTLGKSNLGTILEEKTLTQALLQQCALDNVLIYPQSRAHKITETPSEIIVESETQAWQTPFLIIADGANSPSRTHLNIPMVTWPYHHQALVSTIATQKPHHETAYQVFHTDGPLAFLPLQDPHHCAIVWSTKPQKANDLMACTDESFNHALQTAFGAKLGACRVISPRHSFPLHMRHVKQYHGKRWIILGDAAHTIHPLAGLGLNVGLADLKAWTTLLDKHQNNLSSSTLLGAYQRQRKHAVWQTIALMESIHRLFSAPLPPIALARGLGMNLLNHLPSIKRLIMEHAAG